MSDYDYPQKQRVIGLYPVRNLSNIAQGYMIGHNVELIVGSDEVGIKTLQKFYQSVQNYTEKAEPNTKNINSHLSVSRLLEQDKIMLLPKDSPELSVIKQIKQDQDNPNWVNLDTGIGFSINHIGEETIYTVDSELIDSLRQIVDKRKAANPAIAASAKNKPVLI
ncbi:MAG TPA: hypothetical protein VGF14_03590 [Alphaproteobacteria bacterium]